MHVGNKAAGILTQELLMLDSQTPNKYNDCAVELLQQVLHWGQSAKLGWISNRGRQRPTSQLHCVVSAAQPIRVDSGFLTNHITISDISRSVSRQIWREIEYLKTLIAVIKFASYVLCVAIYKSPITTYDCQLRTRCHVHFLLYMITPLVHFKMIAILCNISKMARHYNTSNTSCVSHDVCDVFIHHHEGMKAVHLVLQPLQLQSLMYVARETYK